MQKKVTLPFARVPEKEKSSRRESRCALRRIYGPTQAAQHIAKNSLCRAYSRALSRARFRALVSFRTLSLSLSSSVELSVELSSSRGLSALLSLALSLSLPLSLSHAMYVFYLYFLASLHGCNHAR